MALSPEEQTKVSELKQKGFSNTQIMGYIASTRRGMTSAISEQIGEIPDKEVQKELSYGQRVIDTNSTKLAQRVEQFGASADRFNAGEQGLLETGVQQAGTALAAGVVDPVTSIASNTPIVKQGLELAGKGINALATSKYSPIKYIGDFFGNSEKLQEAVKLYDTDPQFKQTVDSTANIINAAATLAGGISSGTKLVINGVNVTKQGGQMLANAGSGVTQTADDIYKNGLDLAQKTKNIISSKVSGKNIDPQLQASIESGTSPALTTNVNISIVPDSIKPEVLKLSSKLDDLISQGKNLEAQNIIKNTPQEISKYFIKGSAERIDNPVALYDEYLTQSKEAITNIKVDPAIAKVGSEIGDAFRSIVKQRQAVGKLMGDELKKFGSNTVEMQNPISSLQQELIDSGATYDILSKKVSLGNTSKFTQLDANLLQKYVDELSALGKSPTAAQLDAFISRIPREINELKSTGGIQTMTNAERIISSNLNSLRSALQPIATPTYNNARSTYSELSKFIDTGSNFLGKVTESGDFAKDASLAKSAVQSILNNGKKDWLIELEALTGNPLLDKSVLALQAMKDAGDFRGVSLLEVLSDGAIPTSKAGVLQKIIDFGLSKTAETIVGSPEEQTRNFINSLLKQQK